MRLLKIGRSPSCDIVLHSDLVSSLHAELTLLDNGDIELEDKGSRNGTYIMNQRIKPGTSVKVRRGDKIAFADVELQWSQVPMPEDNSAYKGIYGIGSHFNNYLQISGATVSRYHATIKQGKDGKMWIIDHSKNGTTVDGVKIPKNTPYRIKRKSAVVCGGVPVDLSRLPWPSESWKYVLAAVAGVLLLASVTFGVMRLINKGGHRGVWTQEQINDRYNSSVVMLVGTFHYELKIEGLSSEQIEGLGFPTEFVFIGDQPYNRKALTNKQISQYCTYTGTGFFISEDGKLITNLHIIKPWLFDEYAERLKMMENWFRRKFAELAESQTSIATVNALFKGRLTATGLSAFISQIKVEGVSDGVLLVPNARFFSSDNAINCTVLSASDDIKKDVALIQSDKMELPTKKSTFVNLTDSLDDSEDALKVGKVMFTIGYPHGLSLQDFKSEKGLQAYCHQGHITQVSSEYSFDFDAVSAGGASGSPIFNDHGMLIGVLNAGVNKENINQGIKAKYVRELITSEHVKE